MTDSILQLIIALPILLLSSTIHEFAHGWVAYKLGDLTAKSMGRLTLNPIAHLDPIGSLVMVFSGFRFGWSKPVPVNEYNFENPVRGTALVALAGPVSNILVAIIGALLLRLIGPDVAILSLILFYLVLINLSLAVFNFIPLPPLDGHRIVRALLPNRIRYYWEKLELYAPFIIALFVLPISPLSIIVSTYIGTTLNFLITLLTGISIA